MLAAEDVVGRANPVPDRATIGVVGAISGNPDGGLRRSSSSGLDCDVTALGAAAKDGSRAQGPHPDPGFVGVEVVLRDSVGDQRGVDGKDIRVDRDPERVFSPSTSGRSRKRGTPIDFRQPKTGRPVIAWRSGSRNLTEPSLCS
jgi:hypothetical protein